MRPAQTLARTLVAALILAGFAPSPAPAFQDAPADAAKAELDRQQGVWEPVEATNDGKSTPPEILAEIRRVVDGEKVYWTRKGKRFAGTRIVLDPSREPKTIDVIADGGQFRDRTVLGIYKFEGDQLTICMAASDAPRPARFEALSQDGQTLMVFRKAAGEAAPPAEDDDAPAPAKP